MKMWQNVINKKLLLIMILLILILTGGYCLFYFNQARAVAIVDGDNAVGILGQTDAGGLPIYTRLDVFDGPSIRNFNSPKDSVIDSVGHRLFVADSGNNRVLVFNLNVSNVLVDYDADYVLGQVDFLNGGNNGLDTPASLVFDASRNYLFVGENNSSLGGSHVYVFDVSTITNGESPIHALGGRDASWPYSCLGQQYICQIRGLDYDGINDRLFVADYGNNRVLVFDMAVITDYENATYVLGQPDFDTSTFSTTINTLHFPSDVAYDSNNDYIYVADEYNHRVVRYNVDPLTISNGDDANLVLGQSDYISNGETVMRNVGGVYYDSAIDRLYVSDSGGSNDSYIGIVHVFNDVSLAIDGQARDAYVGNSSAEGSLYFPTNPAVSDNLLYVTTSSRVLVFDITVINDGENATQVLGQFSSATNLPTFAKARENNGPNNLGYSRVNSVELDDVEHRLFVADNYTGGSTAARIMVYDLDANNVPLDLIPDNVIGQPDFDTLAAGGLNHLDSINDMAYDSVNQRLFVGEQYNSRVLVFDLSEGISDGMAATYVLGDSAYGALTAQSDLNQVLSVEYDAVNDRLFVGDVSKRVMIFDLTGGIVNGMDAVYLLGGLTFDSPCVGPTDACFSGLSGLSYDSIDDVLYVTDRGAHRVLQFNFAGGITNGMSASHVLGQSNFTNNSYSQGGTSGLNYPSSLSLDEAFGRLFVRDDSNQRVLVFDVNGIIDGEAAINVLGRPNYDYYLYQAQGPTQSLFGDITGSGLFYNASDELLYVGGGKRVLLFNAGPRTPTPPTACAISNLGTTTLDVTWTDNSSDETGFDLEISTNGSDWTAMGSAAAEAESYTVEPPAATLYSNSQYYFRVFAVNDVGASAPAECAPVYTLAESLGTPVATNMTTKDDYVIDLGDWSGVILYPPSGMKIEQDTGCDGYETTIFDNVAALADSPYSVTGLDGNTCYKFRISVYNGDGVLNVGDAAESNSLTLPPGQPTGLSATFVSTTGVTWDWNDVTDATGYQVYDNNDVLLATIETADSTYIAEDLTPNTFYTVYVRATNANGEGMASSEASTYTGASVPIALTTTAITTDSIAWDWQSGGGQKDFYASSLDYEANLLDWRDWDVASDWLQTVNLEPNRLATLYVLARNESLEETPAPGPSVTYYTHQADPTGMDLMWAEADNLSVQALGDFRWLEDGSSGFYYENLTDETNSGWIQTDSWVNSGLVANTQYTYQVTARNGDSVLTATSDEFSFYTTQNTPTGVDGNFDSEITMELTAVGTFPNLGIGDAALYFENLTNATNSGWVTTNSWLDEGLVLDTTYEYRVKARNFEGTETEFTEAIPIEFVRPSGDGPQIVSETIYICNDGLDNDGDGLIDFPADPGCSSVEDMDEYNEPVIVAPIAPTMGIPQILSATSIQWSFVDNADNEEGFILKDKNGQTLKTSAGQNQSSIAVTDLTPNTAYQATVLAYNSIGNSPVSALSSLVYTLASVPSIINLSSVDAQSVHFQLNTDSNPTYTKYAIYESSTSQWLQSNGNLGTMAVYRTYADWLAAGEYITISGLQEGHEYLLLAKAINEAGTGSELSSSANIVVTAPLTANLVISKKVGINVSQFAGLVEGIYFGKVVSASGLAGEVMNRLPWYSNMTNVYLVVFGAFVLLFVLGLVLNGADKRVLHRLKHLRYIGPLLADLRIQKGDHLYQLIHRHAADGEQKRYQRHHFFYRYAAVSWVLFVVGVIVKLAMVVVLLCLVYTNIGVQAYNNQSGSGVAVGDVLSYRIDYQNTGKNTATNVVLTDLIPVETSYVSNSLNVKGSVKTEVRDGDNCMIENNTINCAIGSLAYGETGYVEFKATVNGAVGHSTVNTAAAAYGGGRVANVSSNTVSNEIIVKLPECSDTLDNDGDGQLDFPDDFGCSSAADNTENSDTFIGAGQTVDVTLSTSEWTYLNIMSTAKARINIKGESHTVELVSANRVNRQISLEVRSVPQNFTVAENSNWAIDSDNNGYTDLLISSPLVLSDNQAIVGLKLKTEVICSDGQTRSCTANNTCSGLQVCQDNMWGQCASSLTLCSDHSCQAICPAIVTCGNSVCDNNETCSTCAGDCGVCPVPKEEICGNSQCGIGETCGNCETDCGVCTQDKPQTEFDNTNQATIGSIEKDIDALNSRIMEATGSELVALQIERTWKQTEKIALESVILVNDVVNNEQVEKTTEVISAPTMVAFTALGAANVATATTAAAGGVSGGVGLLTYLQFFAMQPLLLLSRKQRAKWGIIYDSITKRPVSLAIVRIFDKATGQLRQTRVSDKNGRYQFIVEPGEYYIEVHNDAYQFPSQILFEQKEDRKYVGLYHGGSIVVTEKMMINYNIPLDPNKKVISIKEELRRHLLHQLQYGLSIIGPVAALISLIISPTVWVGLLLVLQVFLIYSFRQMTIPPKLKNWGVIMDSVAHKPLNRAVVRIFDSRYNKLLESQITDSHGRYGFLVTQNDYYITAEKVGFEKYQSEVISVQAEDGGLIARNVELQTNQ